jgi:lambda repressor-like predicted transcriptional regulator
MIGPAAFQLAMSAPALIAAGAALAIGGTSMTYGAIALGFGTSFLSRAIERLAESSDTLTQFTAAAEQFASLSFSALNSSVIQLGNVSTNMVSHIDRLVAVALKMENTEIDAQNFADSLTAAASQLDIAAKSLQGPAATLTTEIDGIVQQVERLIAAEAQIKEIGQDIAEVVQQPQDTEQPNEVRNVEKVTEAVNAMVEVKQDNAEMVALLARLVELMEAEAEGRKDREGFFQNEGGRQPSGKKFKEAGVDL